MAEIVAADKFMHSHELTSCLDFTSKLVSSGKDFKFYVKIGNSFVFNLSSKESGTSSSIVKNRNKKTSPSTKLRNARRLQDFMEKKKKNSTQETSKDARKSQDAISNNLVNTEKETFQCDQCELESVSGHELSEHKKVKHNVKQVKCDQCESVFENEKGLKCHQGKKPKLTLSPIPQVDGHLEEIDVEVELKQHIREPVKEESSLNPNIIPVHNSLNEHINSCREAQVQAKKASS